MKCFQYHILRIPKKGFLHSRVRIETDELEEELNKLGRAGWELVSDLSSEVNGWTQEAALIFKRELVD